MAPELTAKRLLIVSGKGGVGKSTVAGALAVAAARRGLRTVVAEVARGDVAGLLGGQAAGGLREIELYPGLRHVTIDRQPALEEYLRDEVPGPLPAAFLARSRAFAAFVDATPGMGELLTIGKVWELTQRPRHKRSAIEYDLAVFDGPASGQLVGLLAAPRTFGSIARVGPVARQGAAIDRMLCDPQSVDVIAVATPEQMAVSETLGLRARLRGEFGIELTAVVVNRLFTLRFSSDDAAALAAAPDDPAVRSARWFDGRARAQRAQLDRLRQGQADVRCATLPLLFSGEVGRGQLEQLAGLLEDRCHEPLRDEALGPPLGDLLWGRRRRQDHGLGGRRARTGRGGPPRGGGDDRPRPPLG